jgi:hypothetical protein
LIATTGKAIAGSRISQFSTILRRTMATAAHVSAESSPTFGVKYELYSRK